MFLHYTPQWSFIWTNMDYQKVITKPDAHRGCLQAGEIFLEPGCRQPRNPQAQRELT